MDLRNSNAGAHLKTAGSALLNWWRAATLDALIVGVLWFIGLELIRVPWAPFWAILGALLQLLPTFGGMMALIGPVISVAEGRAELGFGERGVTDEADAVDAVARAFVDQEVDLHL